MSSLLRLFPEREYGNQLRHSRIFYDYVGSPAILRGTADESPSFPTHPPYHGGGAGMPQMAARRPSHLSFHHSQATTYGSNLPSVLYMYSTIVSLCGTGYKQFSIYVFPKKIQPSPTYQLNIPKQNYNVQPGIMIFSPLLPAPPPPPGMSHSRLLFAYYILQGILHNTYIGIYMSMSGT